MVRCWQLPEAPKRHTITHTPSQLSSLGPHLVQHAIPAVQATQVEVLQLLQLLLCAGSHALRVLSVCRPITASSSRPQPGEWAIEGVLRAEPEEPMGSSWLAGAFRWPWRLAAVPGAPIVP